MSVAVVGAGPAGLALAADLVSAGEPVSVLDRDASRLEAVSAAGGVRLSGKVEGFAALDVAATVAGASAVFVAVPGPELGAAVAAFAGALEPDAVVVLATGGTGAAFEAAAILQGAGARPALVAEIAAFPFTCTLDGTGAVWVTGVKRSVGVGVLGEQDAVERLERLLPRARLEPSVLHTGLTNMNSVLHVAPMVLNAGRIEAGERFEFYGDGITPAVAAVVEAYDAERVAVAAALGVQVPTLSDWAGAAYGVTGEGVFGLVQALQRDVYRALPAPAAVAHRFLDEDVPCGTVPVAGLGELLGVPVPVHRGLAAVASALCGVDFEATGRTVERLGLSGLDADGVRARAGLGGGVAH